MLYGTVTFDTPRKISQLAQTPPGLSGRWLPPVPLYMLGYTTVYAGLPLVNLLQTKTMSVQGGAAPSNTAPARYCVASSGAMNPP